MRFRFFDCCFAANAGSSWKDALPLVMLTLAHLLSGPCLAFLAFLEGPEIVDAIYQGLVFSQVGLLGIWGGLATHGRSLRLVGVATGLAYLIAQFCFSVNDWELSTLLFIFLPTATVGGVMLVTRWLVVKLERPTPAALSPPAEGLQFSLRQLLLFTLIIGCLLGIVRWLQPPVRQVGNITLFATVLFGCVSIAIAAVWATLGKAPPLRRGCALWLYGLFIGCVSYQMSGNGLWFWTTIMLVDAAVLQASLLVVRQCGFRLVRVHATC